MHPAGSAVDFFEKVVISNYVLCCSAAQGVFSRVFDEGFEHVKNIPRKWAYNASLGVKGEMFTTPMILMHCGRTNLSTDLTVCRRVYYNRNAVAEISAT